jgi:putative hemolysin
VALPMKISSIVTAPFIWLLTHSTDFYWCFTDKTHRWRKVTEEEIKASSKKELKAQEVQEIEQDIVERVFTLETEKFVDDTGSQWFYPCILDKEQARSFMLSKNYILFIRFTVKIMMISFGVVNLKIFCSFWNEDFNLSSQWLKLLHDGANWLISLLENFKVRGYIMFLYLNMVFFQGVITLTDILEALVWVILWFL